jgi:hypothetical protein
MIELLEQVFKKASTLSLELQDALAREVLQGIEWENRWDKTFEKSQDVLNKLTEKAMREYESGKLSPSQKHCPTL